MSLAKKLFPYLVFIILALILPSIWMPKNQIYISEEDNFANFQNVLYRNLYSWAPPINNGQPVTLGDQAAIIPNGIFYYLLSYFGLDNHLIQKIYLSIMIFITFISISYFLKLITNNRLIIVLGSLFYYFNFYVWSTFFYSAKMSQLILIPLIFTLTYKFLLNKNYKYAVYNFWALFFFQPIFVNLPTAYVTLLAYPLAIAYFMFSSRIKFAFFIKTYIVNLLKFFALTLPFFIYYATVVYFSFIYNDSYIKLRKVLTFSSIGSPINLIMQFRGSWWEFASTNGISYNPWLNFYSHPLVIFSSFALMIIALSVFLKKTPNRNSLYWLIFFLFSILLASGTSFYPDIYKFLYDKLPFFYIFREPWAKFTPLLIFSSTALLTLSLESKKKHQDLFIGLCLIFIIVKGTPFFSDRLFNNVSRRWNIPFMQLPNHWSKYEKWSKNNLDKKVISIPINYFKRDWKKEHLGNANHPMLKLFGYTHVMYNLSNSNFGYIIDHFIKNKNPNFYKIASIDYALVQNDIHAKLPHYKNSIKNYNDLLKERLVDEIKINFDNKLFLYSIKPDLQLPQIYAAKNIIKVDSSISESNALNKLMAIVSDDSYKIGSAIVFKDDNEKFLKDSTYVPILSFNRINPTKYRVRVRNVNRKFLLVFNESFHTYWKIYSTKNPSTNIYETWIPFLNPNIFQLSNDNHIIANGYANAWVIDPNTICKKGFCSQNTDLSYDMELIIEYWPQRIFYLLLIGSSFVTLGCLLAIAYILIKSRIR